MRCPSALLILVVAMPVAAQDRDTNDPRNDLVSFVRKMTGGWQPNPFAIGGE